MSAWTKFATKFFHQKQKQNPDYKFSQALKQASPLFKKMKKGGSSKKQRGGDVKMKTDKDGKLVECEENDDDVQCKEEEQSDAIITTDGDTDGTTDGDTDGDTHGTNNNENSKIDNVAAAAAAHIDQPDINNINITNGVLGSTEGDKKGGRKSRRKSKKAGKKSQKKSKKAKKAGSKKSKK